MDDKQAQVASFIGTHLQELASLAQRAGLDTLCFLLESEAPDAMSEPTRTAHRDFQKLAVQDKVVRLGRAEPLLPTPRTPLVRIHLLGSMRATTWLGHDVLPRSRKARALMAFLCMNAGAAVTRYRISGMLWDRVPESQANASFRQALRQLTVALEPLADELIVLARDTIRLDASACWIDARAVLAPEPPPARGSRGDLAALCPGEMLEGLDGISASFDQWLITERTRFTEQLRELLEAELRDAAATGAERRAAVARRVIGFDPTHEGASRALMRALADMGERAQALQEYERCRDALRTVLDVEPSSETRALHEALRAFNAPTVPVIRQAAGSPAPDWPRAPTTASARTRLRVKVLPFQAHAAHAERLALRAQPGDRGRAGALSMVRCDRAHPVSAMAGTGRGRRCRRSGRPALRGRRKPRGGRVADATERAAARRGG